MFRQPLPNFAPVLFHDRAIADMGGHADALESDAGTVEQPQEIVVGPQKQGYRIFERLVTGEPRRIRMTVRTDDGKLLDCAEQLSGEPALCGIGGKVAMGIKMRGHGIAQFSAVKFVAGAYRGTIRCTTSRANR